MAINKLRYYLGPLGYLQALPPMRGGSHAPDAPLHIPSGSHTSLSGRVTYDRTGVPKRSWELVWDNLREPDRLGVEAAIHRSAQRPLRLIDPRSSNRLPADVSAGGSLTLSADGFDPNITVTDGYSRTVASTWTVADTGHAWTNTGGAAGDFSVSGGRGRHAHNSVNVARTSTVAAPLGDNWDITMAVGTTALATGSSHLIYVQGQWTDASNYLAARAEFTPTGAVNLALFKNVAGVLTSLASAPATGLTHVANNMYFVRLKRVGTLLRAKIWLSTDPVPPETTWHVSTVETVFLGTAANFGVRTLLASGNTNTLPLTFLVDDLTLVGTPPITFTPGAVPTAYLGLVAGGLVWPNLFLGCRISADYEKVPVLAGSTYRFSIWALGTAQIKLFARTFDVAGAETALATSSVQALTGAWTRYSWLWTPAGGVVSAYFGLQVDVAGSLTTSLWQVEIDQALTDWSFGAGCPEVIVAPEIDRTYWRAKYHQIALTLREA